MKALVLAALMSLTLSGTAMAQAQHQQPRNEQHRSQQTQRKAEPMRAPARQQSNTQRGGNHTPPRHWKKSRGAYQSHVTACQRRYKSYNPRTDTFNPGRGRTTICRL
jgi:Ni/Co efflux regulator RcnB